MRSCLPAVLTLVAALGWGGAAPAQEPAEPPASPTVEIPPPQEPINEASVKAWVAQHIDTAGWLLAGADLAAASFLSADGVTVGEDGFLRSEVRREYFGAAQLGPNGSRSVRQSWIVNCKGRSVWVRRISVYPEHNLKGAATSRESPEPRWTELSSGSINEKLMIEICATPSKGKVRPELPKTPA